MSIGEMVGMVVLSLVATVAMALTLLQFLRKLRRIEEERWGKTPWKGDK